ncbi:MAG: tetraacyldisaccharide 4'-kinase [Fimbriimonadales bacterium]
MERTERWTDAARWERVWGSQPPLWLRGLARLYTLGWHIYAGVYRLGLKRRTVMPVPVIGVGSLWVGGVGKTPLTIAIARVLQEAGARVAVLTHGYGGSHYHAGTLIDPAQHPDPAVAGDEAAELRLALPDVPIAVGKWRVRVAQAAIARWSPDALVLDDGFQHLPLARTLDWVLLPAESPLGNGYCVPAGPLREPPSGLRRASGVVWVRWAETVLSEAIDDKQGLQMPVPTYTATIAPTMLLRIATGERLPLSALQGRPLTLLCGIARPHRFLQTAQAQGYRVEATLSFPDHHAYAPDDLRPLTGKTVLTTLKDAVKLRTRLPEDCDAYALLIEAHLEDALRSRLLSVLTGTPAPNRES